MGCLSNTRRLCRIRSFRRTAIFGVVILAQVWLAIPILFGQPSDIWPEKYDISLADSFEPSSMPIVIFSSYRPALLEKALESIGASGNIIPTVPCLFILHQTKGASMDDINETYKVLAKITFCRKLVWTFGNHEEERTPEIFNALWWNVMKKVFDEVDTFQLMSNKTFANDVLFIKDDVVLSADFMECMWYTIAVKNSVPGVLLSSLQGVGGDNLIENHPDTFVVSHVPVVQSMCYAFNSSTWEYIKIKFKKVNSLDYSEKEWSLHLGMLLLYHQNGTTLKIVTPTISRVWHVVGNDSVSASGLSSKIYKHMDIPPWKKAQEQRYLNRNKANTLSGTRDMYGRLCHPCELESKTFPFSSGPYQCHCLCPTNNLQKYWNWQMAGFMPKRAASLHCSLVSHLMGMVVCLLVGLLMFGFLITSR